MDVMHQVFEVNVHTCLCVDRLLLTGNQVVELDDADRHRLVLLRLNQELSKLNVFDKFHADDVVQVC